MRLRTKTAIGFLFILISFAVQMAHAQQEVHADEGHEHAFKSILEDLSPAERESYTSQTLISKLSEKSSLKEKEWTELGEGFQGMDLRLGTRSDDLQKGDRVTLHTRIYSVAGDLLVNTYDHGPTTFYMGYNHEEAAGQIDIERMIKGMKAGGKRLIIAPGGSPFAMNITHNARQVDPDLNFQEDDPVVVEAVIFHVRRPDLTKKFDYQ